MLTTQNYRSPNANFSDAADRTSALSQPPNTAEILVFPDRCATSPEHLLQCLRNIVCAVLLLEIQIFCTGPLLLNWTIALLKLPALIVCHKPILAKPKAAVRSVVNTGKRQGLTAYQSIQQALSIDGSLFSPS